MYGTESGAPRVAGTSETPAPLRLLVAALLTVVAAVLPAGPALAAFPGQNGPIAFERSGDLFLADQDGTVRPLATTFRPESNPAISPDGSRVAFERDNQLAVMGIDGSGLQMLTSEAGAGHKDPTWSPDGSTILFSYFPGLGTRALHLVAISPDGTNRRQVTPDLASLITATHPAWSPDGSEIVFALRHAAQAPGNPPGVTIEQVDLAFIRPDGTGLTILPTIDAGEYGPAWSPDGSRVAFERVPVSSTDLDSDIWLMNADGTSRKALLPENSLTERDPAWSPDGTRLVWAGGFGTPTGMLASAAPDGSGLRELASGTPHAVFPDWGPTTIAGGGIVTPGVTITPSDGTGAGATSPAATRTGSAPNLEFCCDAETNAFLQEWLRTFPGNVDLARDQIRKSIEKYGPILRRPRTKIPVSAPAAGRVDVRVTLPKPGRDLVLARGVARPQAAGRTTITVQRTAAAIPYGRPGMAQKVIKKGTAEVAFDPAGPEPPSSMEAPLRDVGRCGTTFPCRQECKSTVSLDDQRWAPGLVWIWTTAGIRLARPEAECTVGAPLIDLSTYTGKASP